MEQKSYHWNATDYAGNSSVQFEWAKELIDKLNLAGRESLLDIGCGDGKVSAAIAARLPRGKALGIDSSPEMIDLAQRTYPRSEHPNLAFQHMDARSISLDARFDVVFSNAALHWVTDHRPVLRGVKECLKRGGRLLFQMGGKGNAEEVAAVCARVTNREPWRECFMEFPFPYGFFGEEEYARFLLDAGLEPVRVELVPKDMAQKGREGFAGWVRTTWLPFTQRVPEPLREKFISEVVSDYIAIRPVDSNGLVHVDMVRLEVEAIRL